MARHRRVGGVGVGRVGRGVGGGGVDVGSSPLASTTVWDMVHGRSPLPVSHKLSTGCPRIDACLGGGVLAGGITDVCGEASAGKSQFCMQLALQSLLPTAAGGLADAGGTASCLYLSTEGRFPSKRFVQMAAHFHQRHRAALGALAPGERLLDRVLISELLEPDEFWPFIRKDLPILVRARGVKLIVVDSIAGICRGEMAHTREGVFQRSRWLCGFAAVLREVAAEHGAAVVTVNQVSALFDEDLFRPAVGGAFARGGSVPDRDQHHALHPFPPRVAHVKPALGLLWSTFVNSRIMLHRSEATRVPGSAGAAALPPAAPSSSSRSGSSGGGGGGGGGGGAAATAATREAPDSAASEYRRYMRLVKSPAFPTNVVCPYVITAAGVRGED